ncbi:uncharacterized protein RMCC_5113 [Mycolicibacterium canariasense]|uniref:Transmembrane protein n=1 Tax=Mycolicibacterium canariasense TaxID=228230 RepID=A0A124E2W8_MYCCR|nr:hypothetical protein [Mycolicibacterium canariasense]MCV7213007.1 hypothetical protein [Mycolicibacterium canariasense]ORV10198.1 hypothetical protein AWB94_07720 [Mycolicibacterium canariasense]GAS98148.1 uncharacterized protein RMCC_5113 [Mycolicibacterium canariasense]
MPEPARIALRLLGLLLLLGGLACAVLLIWPGPAQIAAFLGSSCAADRSGISHPCSWLEAADLVWTGCWVSIVIGFVLRLLTRPAGKGPLVLDVRRWR